MKKRSNSNYDNNNNNKKQKVDLTNDMFGIYILSREKYPNEEEKKQWFKKSQILKLLDKYKMDWNTLLQRIPKLTKIPNYEQFIADETKWHSLLEIDCNGRETNTWHKIGCTYVGFGQCQNQTRYSDYPAFEAVWDLSNTIITLKKGKQQKTKTLRDWRNDDESLVQEFVYRVEYVIHYIFSRKGFMESKAGGSRDKRHEEIYGLSLNDLKQGISYILKSLNTYKGKERFTTGLNTIIRQYSGKETVTVVQFDIKSLTPAEKRQNKKSVLSKKK